MKLELKHFVPYSIYGIKVYAADTVWDIRNIHFPSETIELENEFNAGGYEYDLHEVKPILYSLDYLTKEITHNGETFVPIERLGSLFNMNIVEYCFLEQNYMLLETIVNQRWYIVEKLLEWRFDIHNLIDKGLAIPVTSDFNPYK